MDASIVDDPVRGGGTQYVTEFDAIPGFWNFLVGLDPQDLIAELVQNDLDQGASRTIISFEETCLTCVGNGEPVSPEGWQRLRMILGAGDKVPAKRSSFGVKNHGLKAAFSIGDEIRLMSAGRMIVQTLYANGPNSPPHPGASERPKEDPDAPTEGCRVFVQYRDTELEPDQGEAIKLDAMGAGKVEALFEAACASMPEQFAGIVSPEITPHYEIVLQHWKLGEARFRFSCTRPRKARKQTEVFQRRCTVSGTYSPLPNHLREQAVRRLVPLKGVLKKRVAEFYRRKRRFFIEISWPIDAKGRPGTGIGRYRYPIGYPANSREAGTGHGTHFNAPFISDRERHAPAWNEATNMELLDACKSLLIDAVAHIAIPQWKADGLNPIVPSADADDGKEVVRVLLAELVSRNALPILNWRQAAELATKGKGKGVKAVVRRLTDRGSPNDGRRYRFVVPAVAWAGDKIVPLLSLLSPRSEAQLDPRAHAKIVALLADKKTPGFAEEFVTFDENDVFDRVAFNGNQWFDAIADPNREFCQSALVRVYLDLIDLALDQAKLDAEKEDALRANLVLPDVDGQATAFSSLYSNASLPSNIPDLRMPPLLDAGIVAHALFKRKKWRIPKYTMKTFLESGTLQAADEETRRKFWKWLSSNGRRVSPRDRPSLAGFVIWPDENSELCKISDLCEPRSGRVGAVLGNFIRRPHREVRQSKLVSMGGRAQTSVRRTPTEDEIEAWLVAQLARFEIGFQPDAATADELVRFEGNVATLLEDRSVAPLLKAAAPELPALARDGTIRLRTELVLPSRSNDRLALPDRFLLRDRQRATVLARLSPALKAPTAAMLLDAFEEDSGNFSALHSRLAEFESITEPDDDERCELARKAIIPMDGQPRAPRELAFAGNKGDYWGDWKIRLSTKGLSQNDQGRFRVAGVTSAIPNQETSHAFFEWLVIQDAPLLRQHISCILRHFLHLNGPTHWACSFTDTPCIPATSRNGLQLLSFKMVQHKPVYLSDAGDIGEDVIQSDRSVHLAIHQAKEVGEPISESLRKLGVKSLREALKEPECVSGSGDVAPASEDVLAHFNELKKSRFRQTFQKRLNELGVDLGLVRYDWQDRLDRVQEIRLGENVELRFRFRGKPYLQQSDAGFDRGTGVFWMKRGRDARSLYESVAKQLIFKPSARPIDLLALERAVEFEVADPSFGRPAATQLDADDDVAARKDNSGQGQDCEENDDLGEATRGHSPFEPDPERNRPEPAPISAAPEGPPGCLTGQTGASGLSENESSRPRSTPDLEKTHKAELKHKHYASHCQMCLCESSPARLAPVGSYIESEEARQYVVDAHHADLVAAGGARHAGNIILLCKMHHENYGRQLTRAGIGAALRNNPKRVSVCYDADSNVNGQQIEVVISGTGEVVKLFFTEFHIEYWLSQDRAS